MTKIVFFDVDGTLVSLNARQASTSTCSAIHQLRKQGILVYIATGRDIFELMDEHLLDGVGYDGLLTNNGQTAYDAQGNLRFDYPIDPREVQALVDWAEGKGLACWLATDKSNILSRITPEVYPAMASIHTKLPPVGDIHQAARERVYKIVLFLSPEEMKEAMTHVPSGRCTQWFSQGFDIIAGSGGKAVAVQKVLRNLGLTAAEAMAFGDGDNDMEMLRLVGTGVAMGNAPDKVKAAADYVTGHVDEDGLAEALRHFGLIR